MYEVWYKITRNKNIGINLFVENIIQLVYSSLLRPGDITIDGGANRGVHTKPMAAAVGKSGMVLAFEAIPKLANELGVALSSADQAIVINRALGACVGETQFAYVKDTHTRSGIRQQGGLSEEQIKSIDNISIPLTTIDSECEAVGVSEHIRFIKLDLEGGEFDALRGGIDVLRTSRPCVVMETGREKSASLYQYERTEWFEFFNSIRYQLFDIFGREFSMAEWSRPGIPPYCLAVSRDSDIAFVKNVLPNLISSLAVPYRILMEKFPD